jgi:hypothetical protein
MAAVVAVAGLALSGAFLALAGHSGRTAPGTLQAQDPARQEWAAKSSALSQLTALSSLGPEAAATIRQATAQSTQAIAQANAALAAATDDATSKVEGAVQGGILSALPADYVPGLDLGASVKVPKPAAFPLPAFSGQLAIGGFDTAAVRADLSPVVARGLHLPAVGVAPLDDLTGQAGAAYATLQHALEGLSLPAGPGGLPVDLPGGLPIGDLPVGGLPVGGLPLGLAVPAQAQNANDAADPDEHGALVAGTHADALLASVEKAYALSQPSLSSLLASYQGLAAQVQALVDAAHGATAQARVDIEAQLADRVAALQDVAARAERQALDLANGQRSAITGAAHDAQAALRQVLKAQAAAVQGAAQADLERLTAMVTQMPSAAEAAQQAIQATVDGAVANLTRLQGSDTAASVAAIQAAGAKAVQKVLDESLARAQALKAAATDLQARADAAVRQLQQAADGTLSTLDGTATQALAKLGDAQAYLTELARAQEAAATLAETAAATAALAKLAPLEQARVAKLVKDGLAIAGTTQATVQAVDALVEQVGTATGAQVQKDIGYVAKVSKDYAQIPTSDRLARAAAWSAVAGTAAGRLGEVLSITNELSGMAGQALQAAQAAKAQIEAMA